MAEKKGESYPQVPSAPNAGQIYSQDISHYHQRPPPPSYEESQRGYQQPMCTQSQGNMYPGSVGSPPPYAGVHQATMYQPQRPMGYVPAQPQYVYNYSAQPHMLTATTLPSQQNVNATNAVTVTYDAGARFKGKGAGTINIPPPPPGCAPTPEQMAALQGQPVILKKKKNSFF